MRSNFLERTGSEVVAVNVAGGLQLPLEHLILPILKDGELYWRHPIGGGLVADSSYAPDDLRVDYDVRVAGNTRLMSDSGIFGQFVIKGNFVNPREVSHHMDEEGMRLREEQRDTGIVARLLAIEHRLAQAAELGDRLF